MGWLSRKSAVPSSTEKSLDLEHVPCPPVFPFAAEDLPDADLPFIPASVVAESISCGFHWLVIGGIVYDCGEFASEHPGGSDILESFRGKDCTWQFYRFHERELLRVYGGPLRIGRTEGVANPFKERPQFVGLRSLEAEFL